MQVVCVSRLLKKLGNARIVGGGVRNPLIGRPVKEEIDIATPFAPERVMRIGRELGYGVVPLKIDHGTVLLVRGKEKYEVTTLRRDVLTDGRWAKVQYTRSWRQDAERRDFTINAMSMDAKGKIYDYVGGLDDIKIPILRFVGDPIVRIKEDYLRILRLFRFWAHYVQPGQQDIAACIKLKDGLQKISQERILAEMLKLYTAENPWPAVGVMVENNIVVQNTIQEGKILSPLTRLALTVDASALPLSRAQKNWVTQMKVPAKEFSDILAVNHTHGYNFAIDYARWYLPEIPEERIPKVLHKCPLLPSEMPNVESGPEMGRRFKELHHWWIRQWPLPNKAQCLTWYNEYYKQK
jgi:hypothetical protein